MSRKSRNEKLRDLMQERALGGLLLRRPANFAWYTGGADNRVDRGAPLGVASVLLTPESSYVLTDNIEAPRMRVEQTPDVEVVEHPWHRGPGALLEELVGSSLIGTDFPTEIGPNLSTEVAPLRSILGAEAVESYRRLGTDAVRAISQASASLTPDTDEIEAAAELAAACRRRGMFSPVLLAASEERLARYRHPIPRGGPLGGRTMSVVCAERGGLFASLTQIIDFREPDPETARRQEACAEILRRMRQEATRPGLTLADAFKECRRFYAEVGFQDGWRDHHQGGTTGYASREVIATPDAHQEIQTGQAFAWNPSLEGTKTEETFVLGENGPEVLTRP